MGRRLQHRQTRATGSAPAWVAAPGLQVASRPSPSEPSAAGLVDDTPTVRSRGNAGAQERDEDDFTRKLHVPASEERPARGVRRAIYAVTRGHVNPGPSAAERMHRELLARVSQPLGTWHTVTVASMKGGVGKTTVSALLGLTLSEHRGDRVMALDANPDAGTLAERLLVLPCRATVRDLIAHDDRHGFTSLADINRFLSSTSHLQVLASEQDPAMSEAFSRADYHQVLGVLTRFFNIIITDSGTGLMHSALGGALETTRSLIVVGAPTIDGSSRASKTIDWLAAHGFDELVADAVVVLSCDRESRAVDRAAVVDHFAPRCRAVVEIPRDPHLVEGGPISLDLLRPATREAALELAAHIADTFSWDFPVPTALVPESGIRRPTAVRPTTDTRGAR